ncbi:IPExxxVDY family protein [Rhizosphaericola mali]|jgi:hypothetical protein|uniref:IPExxxVDY family protein n=1 Tax=Rhizosphaericola mali TaxID=2545455 RepID=A0A5P2G3V9_9BACT|nr:IPExxxVDY family protein [Rhizosphaericola mali]QES90506.1 IPExxxVDY family protein [Rhizosphaericola mali]
MKLVLNSEDLTSDFYEDARVLGIVSKYKNYKFIWSINQHLDLNFKMIPDYEIELPKKNKDCYFSVFQHSVKNTSIDYFIYQNYFEGEFLLPELKNIDFICLVKGDFSADQTQWRGFLDNLKSVSCIQMASEISLDQIKSKENLIF